MPNGDIRQQNSVELEELGGKNRSDSDDEALPRRASISPEKRRKRSWMHYSGRRRRPSKPGSLYSLAALAHSGEVRLHQRSEPNVHFDDQQLPPAVDIDFPVHGIPRSVSGINQKAESAESLRNCSREDETDLPAKGSLVSFLGKIGLWKKSSSVSSLNVQIQKLYKDPKTTSFEKLNRRFSQIKRRRSSYYFSGKVFCGCDCVWMYFFIFFVNLILNNFSFLQKMKGGFVLMTGISMPSSNMRWVFK